MSATEQTTRVYRGKMATVYHGDCRDVMATFPRSLVYDLLVTDPPYGQNYVGDKFPAMQGDDGSLNVKDVIQQALKHLRAARHLYVFGPDVISGIADVAAPTELIWDKIIIGNGAIEDVWAKSFEPVWFGVYQPSIEMRMDGSGATSARLRRASVLRFGRKQGRQVTRHPTEKPTRMLRELIEASSRIDETVFDPFAGSGSTLAAATIMGRNSIGIEQDEEYFKTAVERVQRAEAIYQRLIES